MCLVCLCGEHTLVKGRKGSECDYVRETQVTGQRCDRKHYFHLMKGEFIELISGDLGTWFLRKANLELE